MEFIKQILVLKEIECGFSSPGKKLSGISRVEIENGVATFYLSLINVKAADCGEYVAFVLDGGGKLFSFPLGKRPVSFTENFRVTPSVKNGFSSGICYVEKGIPLLIAYARSESVLTDAADFRKKITDKYIEKHREEDLAPDNPYAPIPPTLPPMPPLGPIPGIDEPEEEPRDKTMRESYDDEAVATENYYEKDESYEEREFLRRFSEDVRTENEMPFSGEQGKTEKGESGACGFQNETGDDSGKEYSEGNTYFESVRNEIEDMFNKFPPEERLAVSLTDSKWIRINYSDNKYYVVGIIREDGKEKYICYGVPAKYSTSPPKELKGFCTFIPLSVFDLKGDGYWMMFQDAVTGDCVKKR